MRRYLLPKDGNFYKANLHAHSTHSDGELTPKQMKELYLQNGYSIIAFTDHNVLNYFKELDEGNFLALCGYELDSYTHKSQKGFPKVLHINAIARDPNNAKYIEKPTEYSVEATNKTIKQLCEANYIVNYNHPAWSGEESSDYLPLEGLTAMEIFNYGCEVDTNDGDGRAHYDIMLKNGKRLYCLATDDNHNRYVKTDKEMLSDSCGGYTVFKAPELTYKAIIEAFDKGEFYASTGVSIEELYFEDNKLCVRCSPASGVFFKSHNIGAVKSIARPTDCITYAEVDLSGYPDLPFIRVEIVNSKGKMAFSNPLWLK